VTDVFADMTADSLAAVGESAVYTPTGGSGQAVDVVLSDDVDSVGSELGVNDYGTTIDIARSAVDQPAHGDTVEITDSDSPYHGTTFTVHEAVWRDQYVTRVSVMP